MIKRESDGKRDREIYRYIYIYLEREREE